MHSCAEGKQHRKALSCAHTRVFLRKERLLPACLPACCYRTIRT
jgi:hypothetical protein